MVRDLEFALRGRLVSAVMGKFSGTSYNGVVINRNHILLSFCMVVCFHNDPFSKLPAHQICLPALLRLTIAPKSSFPHLTFMM